MSSESLNTSASPEDPMVSVYDIGKVAILKTAYVEMGRPEYIECYLADGAVGLKPLDDETPDAYKVSTKQTPSISASWLDLECPWASPGRYELEYHETNGLWVFGPRSENVETFERLTKAKGSPGGFRVVCPACRYERAVDPDVARFRCPRCDADRYTSRGRIAFLGDKDVIQRLADGPAAEKDWSNTN